MLHFEAVQGKHSPPRKRDRRESFSSSSCLFLPIPPYPLPTPQKKTRKAAIQTPRRRRRRRRPFLGAGSPSGENAWGSLLTYVTEPPPRLRRPSLLSACCGERRILYATHYRYLYQAYSVSPKREGSGGGTYFLGRILFRAGKMGTRSYFRVHFSLHPGLGPAAAANGKGGSRIEWGRGGGEAGREEKIEGAALAIVGGNSFRDVVAAACPSSSSSEVVVAKRRREGGRRKDGAHELCWRFRLFGVLQSSSRLLFLLHRGTLSVPICRHPLPGFGCTSNALLETTTTAIPDNVC